MVIKCKSIECCVDYTIRVTSEVLLLSKLKSLPFRNLTCGKIKKLMWLLNVDNYDHWNEILTLLMDSTGRRVRGSPK